MLDVKFEEGVEYYPVFTEEQKVLIDLAAAKEGLTINEFLSAAMLLKGGIDNAYDVGNDPIWETIDEVTPTTMIEVTTIRRANIINSMVTH